MLYFLVGNITQESMEMKHYLEQFLQYIQNENGVSVNTVDAYRRDIRELERYLDENSIHDLPSVTRKDIVGFFDKIKEKGRSATTLRRKVSSIRSFFSYLYTQSIIPENPARNVHPPHVTRNKLKYFDMDVIQELLSLPDDSRKGLRDRALLELMYSTGIRVTEVIEVRLSDINTEIGYITCNGEFGKARIIPLGKPCCRAVKQYMEKSRPELMLKKKGDRSHDGAEEDDHLFFNLRGQKLTRQGIWKIVNDYSEKAGYGTSITPQALRNSFAVHMIQNGADLKTMQELLGLENPAAMQIYMQVSRNRIKEVFDKTHPRA